MQTKPKNSVCVCVWKGKEMHIQNLQKGMVIKNYKALCEVLGVEAKVGKGRTLKHKHFEQYFSYEKKGHSYIIKEIYINAENTIKRGGNNKVFVDDFKRLMLYMLYNNKTECMLMSKGSMFKAMNLVNENYIIARNNIPKLSEIIELPQSAIYEFYDYNSTKLRDTVERNLRSCRSCSMLMFETVVSVAINETIIATNEFGKPIVKNGNVVSHVELVYREATKEERQKILEFENEVKLENNWIDNKAIFFSGKWKYFKQEVETRLKKANTNIQFYYDAYRITYNNKDIEKRYNELCKDENKSDILQNINNNIVKSINKATKARHTKAINSKAFGTYRTNRLESQASDNYVEEHEQLTFTLISQEAKSLKHEFTKNIDYNKLSKINSKGNQLSIESIELEWEIGEEIPF